MNKIKSKTGDRLHCKDCKAILDAHRKPNLKLLYTMDADHPYHKTIHDDWMRVTGGKPYSCSGKNINGDNCFRNLGRGGSD